MNPATVDPGADTPRGDDLAKTVICSIHQGARESQEDAYGRWMDDSSGPLFVVVADGAGGHGGGALAAQAVIRSAGEAWKSRQKDVPFDAAAWLLDAHDAVNRAAAEAGCSARSACAACTVTGTRLHWVHAGDVRLILFRKGRWLERTRDDSVVQVLFERGEISEEEMGTHPDQSRLLQSLGGDEAPTPRCGSAELAAGDSVILCSDGFWERLDRSELEKLVSTPAQERRQAMQDAMELAVRRGGPKADNATAIMIHFARPARNAAAKGHRVLQDYIWVWVMLAALLAGLLIGKWLRDLALEHRGGGTQQPLPEFHSDHSIHHR